MKTEKKHVKKTRAESVI